MQRLIQSSTVLGRALRDARRGANLTQVALAEKTGFPQGTISKIERGALPVSFDTLLRLLSALKLELILRPRGGCVSPDWEDAFWVRGGDEKDSSSP